MSHPFFGKPKAAPTAPAKAIASKPDKPALVHPNEQVDATMVDVSGLSAEQACDKLVEAAATSGASDLFISAGEDFYAAQTRHLGIVRPLAMLTKEQGRKVVAYMLSNSGMQIDERRRPQDGRWIYQGEGSDDDDAPTSVDLRINLIPTMYGEDVAVRLLTRGRALYKVENLGMTREQQQHFNQMINSPSGLILVTGPTGSGKTATLYSALLALNTGDKKINTIEDPIEYAVMGLHQSGVNSAIDLGFAELLRSVLRQSPDVIMIGEIRDAETARTAVHAANSGVVVLATLHAASAAGAIQSMRAYGVKSHFLGTSLRGVVSQRLVRTLDPASRVEIDLADAAPHTFDEIKDLLKPGEGTKLYMPGPGGMGGYSDRTGIYEVLPISRRIRELIANDRPTSEIRHAAADEDVLSFRQAALLKVAQGATTTEEVFRVIPTEQMEAEEEELSVRRCPRSPAGPRAWSGCTTRTSERGGAD